MLGVGSWIIVFLGIAVVIVIKQEQLNRLWLYRIIVLFLTKIKRKVEAWKRKL